MFWKMDDINLLWNFMTRRSTESLKKITAARGFPQAYQKHRQHQQQHVEKLRINETEQ
ncbi:hypothetical protein RO3G_01969 [Rhizopus delemar RA 99-880]|uniref:Uncharacterized protein n=1 Tax=Rhizopus delemar (strain RA 99-880 / ATCC MYA-4621 / FGSC 9543 / NRRL 43880) TaxID=246409 RepID=I1BM35_RHIO9|nr:hypothetical protein RO3G_01969 [Rhizopus delemar RA 99-880]|eukprot:EIE77265.1 hypothetical protein RO3G_01969 [Rhizopus delemar RA 99-880]